MTQDNSTALEAYGRFVDAVAQEFAEKGLEQARAIFAFHLRAVSQALANHATIRDTDEDAVEADMRAYAEAAMQHGWKTAVDAAANRRLVDLYARDWFEKNPPKCARLASSTTRDTDEDAEKAWRQAVHLYRGSFNRVPSRTYDADLATVKAIVAAARLAEPDEPIEEEIGQLIEDELFPLFGAGPYEALAAKIKAMLSQRKAEGDASGERKC